MSTMSITEPTTENMTTISPTSQNIMTTFIPLTSDFEISAYQSGNCFIEINVNYVSTSAEDDLITFFTQTKERCCLSCTRLEKCRSWSYEITSQTCILKEGYRPNPIVQSNYASGFKPSDLFTLSIIRGLEFSNLNNSVYDFLFNYSVESSSTTNELYLFVKTHLEKSVRLIKIFFIIMTLIFANELFLFNKFLRKINQFELILEIFYFLNNDYLGFFLNKSYK